jgi:hypothetical protein
MSRPPHKPEVLPDPALTELLGNEPAEARAAEPAPEPIAEPAPEPIAEPAPRRPLSFSPFDQFGHVSRNIDPAIVENLPDNVRAALMVCLTACKAAEDSQAKIDALSKSVNEAMRTHDAALLAFEAGQPVITHQDALKAVLAAHNPDIAKPKKPRPANPKLKAALTEAVNALVSVRDDLIREKAEFKILSRNRGDAIARYMASQEPITFESVVRAHILADGKHREGLANGTIAPPPEPEPRHVWPIEIARQMKPKPGPRYLGSVTPVRR